MAIFAHWRSLTVREKSALIARTVDRLPRLLGRLVSLIELQSLARPRKIAPKEPRKIIPKVTNSKYQSSKLWVNVHNPAAETWLRVLQPIGIANVS